VAESDGRLIAADRALTIREDNRNYSKRESPSRFPQDGAGGRGEDTVSMRQECTERVPTDSPTRRGKERKKRKKKRKRKKGKGKKYL